MTLQNAQAKVRKAARLYEFAKKRDLPKSYNFPLIAFNKCKYELSFEESVNFEIWYDKFMKKQSNEN